MICAYVRKRLRCALCARRPLCWKTSVRPRAFCRRLDLRKVYFGVYVKGADGQLLSSWMSRTASRGRHLIIRVQMRWLSEQERVVTQGACYLHRTEGGNFSPLPLPKKIESLPPDHADQHRYHIPLLTSIPLPTFLLQKLPSGIEGNTGTVFLLEDHGCSPAVEPSRFVRRVLNPGRTAPFPPTGMEVLRETSPSTSRLLSPGLRPWHIAGPSLQTSNHLAVWLQLYIGLARCIYSLN